MTERITDIVEDFLSEKNKGSAIPQRELKRRIIRTRVPKDSIDDIILEMEDEWDREELHQFKLKKAKRIVILAGLVTLCLMSLSIFSALGFLFNGRLIFISYGGIAVGFLACYQSFTYIRKSKLVIERREIKWRRYDKYKKN